MAAWATLDALFQHPTPFDADARFPEGAVYLPLDHGKFGQCMYRIIKELQRIEAATAVPSKRFAAAFEDFVEAVGAAAATATSTWGENPKQPVVCVTGLFSRRHSS
ncbi:hypothetical protein ACP70R_026389 [Stipagrostis hirtigluma subsp. patula]